MSKAVLPAKPRLTVETTGAGVPLTAARTCVFGCVSRKLHPAHTRMIEAISRSFIAHGRVNWGHMCLSYSAASCSSIAERHQRSANGVMHPAYSLSPMLTAVASPNPLQTCRSSALMDTPGIYVATLSFSYLRGVGDPANQPLPHHSVILLSLTKEYIAPGVAASSCWGACTRYCQ